MNEAKAQPAQVSGQAGRTPAVKAQPAVLKATVHITRKETGKVETYEITGTPVAEKEAD